MSDKAIRKRSIHGTVPKKYPRWLGPHQWLLFPPKFQVVDSSFPSCNSMHFFRKLFSEGTISALLLSSHRLTRHRSRKQLISMDETLKSYVRSKNLISYRACTTASSLPEGC